MGAGRVGCSFALNSRTPNGRFEALAVRVRTRVGGWFEGRERGVGVGRKPRIPHKHKSVEETVFVVSWPPPPTTRSTRYVPGSDGGDRIANGSMEGWETPRSGR